MVMGNPVGNRGAVTQFVFELVTKNYQQGARTVAQSSKQMGDAFRAAEKNMAQTEKQLESVRKAAEKSAEQTASRVDKLKSSIAKSQDQLRQLKKSGESSRAQGLQRGDARSREKEEARLNKIREDGELKVFDATVKRARAVDEINQRTRQQVADQKRSLEIKQERIRLARSQREQRIAIAQALGRDTTSMRVNDAHAREREDRSLAVKEEKVQKRIAELQQKQVQSTEEENRKLQQIIATEERRLRVAREKVSLDRQQRQQRIQEVRESDQSKRADALRRQSELQNKIAQDRRALTEEQLRGSAKQMKAGRQIRDLEAEQNNLVRERAQALRAQETAQMREQLEMVKGIASAVAVATVGFGIFEANQLEKITATTDQLLVAGTSLQEYREQIFDVSQRFGTPIMNALEAGMDFLPLIRATGVEFETLFKTAQQLAAIDPQQGIKGALISIREFLSGDEESLIRRFELPATREQLTELFKAGELEKAPEFIAGNIRDVFETADNNTQKALIGLSAYLEDIGLTGEALENLGIAGFTAFERLSQSVQFAVGTAFMPLTDVLQTVAASLANILNTLATFSPTILKIIGTFGTFAAAALTLSAALSQVGKAMAFLKGANVLGGASVGFIKGGLGVGAAVGLGAVIASAINKGLADSGVLGGEYGRRMSESPFEETMSTLEKSLLLLTEFIGNKFIELGNTFAKALLFITHALQGAGVIINKVAQSLALGVANVVNGLANFINGVMPGAANGLAEWAQAEQRRLLENIEQIDSDYQQVGIDHENRLKALNDATLDMYAELDKTIFGRFVSGSANDDDEEGLEIDRDSVIENMRKFQEDTEKALQQFNERRADLERQHQQRLLDIAKQYAERIEDARRSLNDKLADLELDLRRDLSDDAKEAKKDRLEAQKEYLEEDAKAAQDHYDRLLEIRRQAMQREEDALLSLDFRAIFEIRRDARRQMEDAQREFAEEQAERQNQQREKLDDIRDNFAEERAERLRDFQRQREDANREFARQRRDAAIQRDRARAEARQAYAQDLSLLRDKYNQELRLRREALEEELKILLQGEKKRREIIQAENDQLFAWAEELAETGQLPAGFVPNAGVPISGGSGGVSVNASFNFNGVTGFSEEQAAQAGQIAGEKFNEIFIGVLADPRSI